MKGKRIVVANWKMNPRALAEAKRLFLGVKKAVGELRGAQVIICPPAIFISELRKSYTGKRVLFGAQDVHFEKDGSYTGEVSAPMLKSVGVSHVIIGHSERRAAGETNSDVQKKVRAALDEKLTVMLCVGERERDHDGEHLHFIKEELTAALRTVAKDELKRLVVVYEPVWAIGKSFEHAMKPHDVHQMSLFVRKVLSEQFDRGAAMKVLVLYGGSVEPENAAPLLEGGDINGFLVGHASLNPTTFRDILAVIHSGR